jgi:peptidoglycan/xylan/chitin deacetylase (PgdA/CDA1 family)
MYIFDIPIVTYHKISNQREFGLTTITPAAFKKQMYWLYENNFKTVTFQQIYNNGIIPEKPIIISFDDTYKSVFDHAFPIMKEYDYNGVLFVISDFIGKINQWEAYPIQRKHLHAAKNEITEMQRAGFEIGSHCKSHKFLPYLKRKDIEAELLESKQVLEKIFNIKVLTCCYPFGGYNEKIISITDSAGYKFGVGNLKLTKKINRSKFSLQRRSIYSIEPISLFTKKVNYPIKKNLSVLIEWLIQKGAYAGIIKNKFNV